MGANDLISLADRPPEERREIARKGGLARQEQVRRRRTLKEELKALLSDPQLQQDICTALVGKALTGSASAFATIRDTIGEKPKTELDVYPRMVTLFELDNMTEDERRALVAEMPGLLDEKGDRIDTPAAGMQLSVEAKRKLLEGLLD